MNQVWDNSFIAPAYYNKNKEPSIADIAGLVLWLSPQNAVSSNGKISLVTDGSGNGNSFSQSNTPQQPDLAVFNNRNIINLPTNQNLGIGSNNIASGVPGLSIFQVINITSNTSQSRPFQLSRSVAGQTRIRTILQSAGAGGRVSTTFRRTDAEALPADLVSTTTYPVSTPFILNTTYDATTGERVMYINNVEVGRSSAGTTGSTMDSVPSADAFAGGPNFDYMTGWLGDTAIYNSVLGTTNRTFVHDLLKNQYGI